MQSVESTEAQNRNDETRLATTQLSPATEGQENRNDYIDDDTTDFSTLIDSESECDELNENIGSLNVPESFKTNNLEKNMLIYQLSKVQNQYHHYHQGRKEKKDFDIGVMKDEYSKGTFNTSVARKCSSPTNFDRNTTDLEVGLLKDEYTVAAASRSTHAAIVFETDAESSLLQLPIDDSYVPSPLHLSSNVECNEHTVSAELVNPEVDRQELVDQVLQAIHHQAVSATEVFVASESDDNIEAKGKKFRCRLYCLIVFLLVLVGTLAIAVGVVLRSLLRQNTVVLAQPTSVAPTTTAPTPVASTYRLPTAFDPSTISKSNTSKAAFQTLVELYLAVDTYVEVTRTSINPGHSEVAMRYGYPIGTWNVSLIRDFTRVFDPLRRKEFDETIDIVRDISNGSVLQPSFTSLAFFNEDLSGWDVSNATSMFAMFARAESFEGIGLEKWNVSNVRDFAYMFYGSTSFKGDISEWDTSRCNNMTSMFKYATKFNGDLTKWETSRVNSMDSMFTNAFRFEGGQGLSNWNVFNVKSMASMFEGAESFVGNISHWDTAKVVDMSYMFKLATAFNGDLSSWSLGSVRSMAGMFNNAYSFEGKNLTQWDTSSVTDMYEVFHGAANFIGTVDMWNVSNVVTFVQMFHSASNFNGNLSMWDTSNVVHMDEMFSYAYKFEGIGLSQWDTGNVKSMHSQFFSAPAFKGNISNWDTSKVEDMSEMFSGAASFNMDLSNWNVSNVMQMYEMFIDAQNFNQSLCVWYTMLNGTTNVNDMFENTGCPIPTDPILDTHVMPLDQNTTRTNPIQYNFCSPCYVF